MNGEGSIEETRRKLEKLWGYPPGAFDPASAFFRDVERVNQALGGGFKLLQEIMAPEQLADRIEAALDAPVRMAQLIPQQLIGRIEPPTTDGFFKRRY